MDYFELIDYYKNDKLSNDVKAKFETEMDENEALINATNNHDVAAQIFDLLIENDIRKQIKKIKGNSATKDSKVIGLNSTEIHKIVPPEKIVALPKKKFSYYVAAALALLILATTFIFINNSSIKNTPKQLYASYYKLYPNLESPSRASLDFTDIKAVRNLAYIAYDEQDYQEVIRLLSNITPGYQEGLDDAFYMGISYMEMNEWKSAIRLFEAVVESNSRYKIDARWYLGLSYLRNEDCIKSKEVFQTIYGIGLDKSEEAGKILQRMEC